MVAIPSYYNTTNATAVTGDVYIIYDGMCSNYTVTNETATVQVQAVEPEAYDRIIWRKLKVRPRTWYFTQTHLVCVKKVWRPWNGMSRLQASRQKRKMRNQ